jgi:hypothetical protein
MGAHGDGEDNRIAVTASVPPNKPLQRTVGFAARR